MKVDEFNRRYGHASKGLGGAVDDGDARHPVHSRMVAACGTWLNEQLGGGERGLVWATYTGRPTSKGTYGTPGVPDLVGWVERDVAFFASKAMRPWLADEVVTVPQALAVECKVLPDKLNEAQAEFRRMAEAAKVLYYLAEWDGEGDDPAAGLREQWGTENA